MKHYYNKDNQQENKTEKVFREATEKLQQIVESGEYEKFLKVQKYFTRYSFMNRLLIYAQCPNATKVAGKSAWKKLGREVIDKSKKIFIKAPCPKSYKTTVIEMVDGEEQEIEKTINYNVYWNAYVYDISNTEGKEVPLTNTRINNNSMQFFYKKLISFSQIPVYEAELIDTIDGYYS